MDKKLGVVVPFRDRYQHLFEFKRKIKDYLNLNKIDYELIIVEQDGAKTFNRGKLLNVGFLYAKKLNCDYVIFHDVDMIPIEVDYTYSEYPVHLISKFLSRNSKYKKIIFDEYFGGVTLFPISYFEQINGYSNEYWGWGYEDDDLLYRCKINGVPLDEKKIKMLGGNIASLKFNGQNAYVEGKNTFDITKPITFFISFYADEIYCDHKKYDDTYNIFTIPGLDLAINYNSYSRYNFEIYDDNENIIYINSDIKTNYQTNICVVLDPSNKSIKMYQDGVLIGNKNYKNNLYDYETTRKFYLGVGNLRNKENPKYYKGLINSFAAYHDILDENEIIELSNNQHFGLTQNFGNYNSANKLQLYYDAKFIKNYKLIDLSGNGNDGKIVNCEIVGNNFNDYKITHIPFRKDGTFSLLEHEENGYVDGAWKDQTTRFNQMKYYNEVLRGHKNTKEDGLNDCKFKELTNVTQHNETHIVVSI